MKAMVLFDETTDSYCLLFPIEICVSEEQIIEKNSRKGNRDNSSVP